MTLLEVHGLTVRYGHVTAVNNVSLALAEGSAVAVLGRNGAGKSSMLEAIAGLQKPAEGAVHFRGEELDGVPPDRRTRLGISMVAEGRRIFPDLSVYENLRLGGFSLSGEELVAALERIYELFPLLEERSAQPAGQLSGGQQQMLCVGRALIGDPQLLILDEPSLGLAPKIAGEVYQQLAKLRRTGISLLVVEQHVRRVLQLVDRVVVLRLGQVVLEEDADDIDLDDPRLRDAYLGEGTT
jgi:branched-chain amino acid transport system ATP-binding protein